MSMKDKSSKKIKKIKKGDIVYYKRSNSHFIRQGCIGLKHNDEEDKFGAFFLWEKDMSLTPIFSPNDFNDWYADFENVIKIGEL